MKKIIVFFIMFACFLEVNSLEIRLNDKISEINGFTFSIYSIKDIFSTDDFIYLKVIKVDKYTLEQIPLYLQINENNELLEISEEKFTFEKRNEIEQILYLKYGYKVNIDFELISFENAKPYIRKIKMADGIIPQYFYINSVNDEIVFNFNTWKIGKKEFYPEGYTFNSLSEKVYYTDDDIERIMKNHATFTQKKLCLVNSRKNKIFLVLEGHNGDNCSGLFIFDVLYNATVNDFKVRLRSEPNLESETLSYFYEESKVRILDQTDEPYEIDGESYYWYKVESGTYPVGWVYGKYLDIENE